MVLLNLTSEEEDIINLMSQAKYLRHKDDDVWMRKYLDRQLTKRRENEAKDLEARYQRIVRRAKGRIPEERMRDMALEDQRQNFGHPVPA